MGKYLQMSRLLRPISYKIIMCMNELFYYYLYAVHTFFASDLVSKSYFSSYFSKISIFIRFADSLQQHFVHVSASDDPEKNIRQHDFTHGERNGNRGRQSDEAPSVNYGRFEEIRTVARFVGKDSRSGEFGVPCFSIPGPAGVHGVPDTPVQQVHAGAVFRTG